MTVDIFKRFATDPKRENEGFEHSLGDKSSLVVARWTNKEAMALNTRLRERHAETLRSPDLEIAQAAADKITIEVVANHVLLGWNDLTYQGIAIQHSVENATKMLQHFDFRQLVLSLAMDADNFRYIQAEKTEKNS
jgi:hypothetical protein